MPTPTQFDIQLETALCRAGVPQSIAYELSKLLPVVRRNAAGDALGVEIDGSAASGIPAGGSTGQVLTKASAADQDATWQTPSGSGLGDFSSNTATSVDSEIMLFSGTGGKTGKRATTTGLLKATSGVLAAAIAGTDYLAPAAIGATVQAYDAGLLSIAGLTTAADTGIYTTASDVYGTYSLTAGGRAMAGAAGTANTIPYFSGTNTVSSTNISAAGRALMNASGTANTLPYFSALNTVSLASITAAGLALLDDADAAAQMTTLGLTANGQSLVTAANYAAMKSLLTLNNVENTALSTWAGTSNITTLGTIGTGTWNATTISVAKGGTGLTALGTAGQVLRVNAGGTALEYGTVSGGAGALDDLTDVVITGATTGQVLKYNGTNWVNDTDSTAGGSTALDDLSDVAITTPTTGHIIRHNGTSFVNVLGTTHFQAADATLTALAGVTTSANQGIYATGSDAFTTYSLTAAGRALAGSSGTANTFPYFSATDTVSLAAVSAGGRALANAAGTANTFPYFSASNTVTLASITAAGLALLDDADAAAQLVTLGAAPRVPEIVTESTTARSLSASDSGKIIRCTNAAATTITVPTGFNGLGCTIVRAGTGIVTIAASSTTLNGASLVLNGQYLSATILPTGTANTFDVIGATGPISNFAGTAAPTVNEDVADGYGAGSWWYDATNNNLYICESAGAGAAVWTQVNGGGGGGSVATDTIFDAAGDLVQGTGSNTSARLAIGTALQVLQVNSGATAVEWGAVTGTGSVVRATSPTLVTPALGTPSAAVLTNATGLPLTTGVTGTLGVANGGTGRATSTTAYGLIAAGTTATGAHQTLPAGATTEILVGGGASALPVWTTATGSGAPVRATSPTLVTPALGTPSSGTLTNCTGLPIATGVSGLAANVATFLATPSSANLAAALTDETGSGGAFVRATGPTISGAIEQLDALPGTNNTYQGRVIAGRNAGATIAQWDAVYLDASGTWQLADANGSGTFPARGLAVAAYASTNPALVLYDGVARNDTWAWTIGGDVYLSTTAGGLTQTVPSTTGDKIQKIGWAPTADSIIVTIGSGEYLTRA